MLSRRAAHRLRREELLDREAAVAPHAPAVALLERRAQRAPPSTSPRTRRSRPAAPASPRAPAVRPGRRGRRRLGGGRRRRRHAAAQAGRAWCWRIAQERGAIQHREQRHHRCLSTLRREVKREPHVGQRCCRPPSPRLGSVRRASWRCLPPRISRAHCRSRTRTRFWVAQTSPLASGTCRDVNADEARRSAPALGFNSRAGRARRPHIVTLMADDLRLRRPRLRRLAAHPHAAPRRARRVLGPPRPVPRADVVRAVARLPHRPPRLGVRPRVGARLDADRQPHAAALRAAALAQLPHGDRRQIPLQPGGRPPPPLRRALRLGL